MRDPEEVRAARQRLSELDGRLVGLLAERVEVARRLGRTKRRHGLPVLDTAQEARVVRRAAEAAADTGLPEESMREIFWAIIGMSRGAQDAEVGT